MASKVSGFKALSRNARSLSQNLQRPMSEASRKALAPILKDAKANLQANGSVKKGKLIRGMGIRQKKGRKRESVTTVVTAVTNEAIAEAHLVEFGTEEHYQPKRGQMHPGAEAKPFLEPAYVANQNIAVKIFGKEIGPSIERQVARMSKRD